MPRTPRIEFPGAWHHVTARGNERRAVYRDDRDRLHFCDLLGRAVEMFGWRIHAYALMDNHFHLLAETPEPNLSRGMQWLNTSYCVWFNRRRQRSGHLLQGRFKSVIVDPAAWGLEASRYIHLNPVRLRRLGLDKSSRQRDRVGAGSQPHRDEVRRRISALRSYRWSSYRAYLDMARTPSWLHREAIWELGGSKPPRARTEYCLYVESAVRQGMPESPWENLCAHVNLRAAVLVRKLADTSGTAAISQPPNGRPNLQQIIAAVERVKNEKWKDFCNRHGDWGRDMVLHLGRKHAGMALRELSQAAGMGDTAVSMAVKRASARIQTDPAAKTTIKLCLEQLQL